MPSNSRTFARRQFLRRTAMSGVAATAVPYIVPAAALGLDARPAPSERITVGFLGVGSHGIGRNLNMFLQLDDAQPVAICDVDTRRIDLAMQIAGKRFGDSFSCQTTQDWRTVIARPDVDAVMITTPDHWHIPMAVTAIRAGKDVIMEKPTTCVREGRLLVDVAQQYGAILQYSTEDRSLAVYHRMAELVRNGRIGQLQRILIGLPSGPGGPGDPTPQPVPKELDYEMWLGPAAWAPYCPARLPFNWRWCRDYSGGMLPDWGMHLLDTAQWGNNSEYTGPITVEGTGKRHVGGLYDTFYDFHLTYHYANGVELQVHSGEVFQRYEGTAGWIENRGWIGPATASRPEILRSVIGPSETRLFTCPAGEHRNFLDCVKVRRDPYFPAEIGQRCSTICHLGNICMELGRKLRWDPATERFPDDAEANRFLARPRREPWEV